MGNTLLMAGAAALALGAWMNWHPAHGPRWSSKWSNEDELGESYKLTDARSFEIRYNPYYAKNVLPANWMRLGIAGPVPPYFSRYVTGPDGEQWHAGYQFDEINVSARVSVGGRVIGPFPVDWWYYNEYKTYDKSVILKIVSALQESGGPVVVDLTYSGGWASRGDFKSSFEVPAGAIGTPPQETMFDRATAVIMPFVQKQWDAHKERVDKARIQKIQRESARRWRMKVAKAHD